MSSDAFLSTESNNKLIGPLQSLVLSQTLYKLIWLEGEWNSLKEQPKEQPSQAI